MSFWNRFCDSLSFPFYIQPENYINHKQPSPPQLGHQLNDFEIRKGKKIGVTISFNNHRLFVGNIPKNRDHDELIEEFTKHARKSKPLPLQTNQPQKQTETNSITTKPTKQATTKPANQSIFPICPIQVHDNNVHVYLFRVLPILLNFYSKLICSHIFCTAPIRLPFYNMCCSLLSHVLNTLNLYICQIR